VAEEIAAVGVSERFGLDDRLTEKNDFCQKGSFKFMKTLDMTEGKPVKLILKFAIQLFIGMLLQQLYNITDTMIVGYGFGENAVAAVGGTSALYSVLMNFANGLNNGYGIIISRAFGGKDWKKLRQGFAVMVILDVAITLVFSGWTHLLSSSFSHMAERPISPPSQTSKSPFLTVHFSNSASVNNICFKSVSSNLFQYKFNVVIYV